MFAQYGGPAVSALQSLPLFPYFNSVMEFLVISYSLHFLPSFLSSFLPSTHNNRGSVRGGVS
jgi:hypothetical protein